MSLVSLDEALDTLRGADSFLLTTHTSPDGDAIGSVLALRHFLQDIGKTDITTACQDPAPAKYGWLPLVDDLVTETGLRDAYDLVVIIDVAQCARIGTIGEAIQNGQRVLVLDHHLETEPCGDLNFMDPTLSSAAEIVVDLYRLAKIPISIDAAACAYVGLSTDTGGFRFGNTNARSHDHAEELVATGIDVSGISARVFSDLSPTKLAMTRVVLGNLVLSETGTSAHSHLTLAELNEHGATDEDTDGLVNYTRDIQGVEVGMLFREISEEVTKVSMRSKSTFDSSACLNAFGGGGHAGAAGATIEQPLQTCIDSVVEAVQNQLSG
ncbi:MAG: DHH family phosphoesterase [Candidatus Hydrogenedentota bacterium]